MTTSLLPAARRLTARLFVCIPTALALVACDASTQAPEDPDPAAAARDDAAPGTVSPASVAAAPPDAATPVDQPDERAAVDGAPAKPDEAAVADASAGADAGASAAESERRPPWFHADTDPDNDDEIGPPPPLPDCEQRLADAGITFKKARIGLGRKRDGVYTCGSKQVVRVRRGPGKIKYSSSPLLTCSMALALADFERVAQEEAERLLGSRIKAIDHLGTYNCRKMANYDLISEHSYANGLDLRRFHLKNGKTITVLEDFRPGEDADTPETEFLRVLSNRLYDDGVFSVVVTPYFDRLHRNHIHVDLARYRVDGSRP